jgi:hypothetical protein
MHGQLSDRWNKSSILQFNTTTQVYNYFRDYKPNIQYIIVM